MIKGLGLTLSVSGWIVGEGRPNVMGLKDM